MDQDVYDAASWSVIGPVPGGASQLRCRTSPLASGRRWSRSVSSV